MHAGIILKHQLHSANSESGIFTFAVDSVGNGENLNAAVASLIAALCTESKVFNYVDAGIQCAAII